jgi:hypothetical protein
MVRVAGFPAFGMHQYTQFWKKHNGKDPAKGFGTLVEKSWYWYQHWPTFIISELEKEKVVQRPGAQGQLAPTSPADVAAVVAAALTQTK